jgi:predicted Zn-dependent protease
MKDVDAFALPPGCRRVFASLAALAFLLGCAKAPYTGRSQLLLVSEEEEAEMGQVAYEESMAKVRLCTDPEKLELVRDVADRIAAAADRPDYEWEVRLIDDDKVANAYALPGGKMAVYTGILPITQTADGLAVVLGHEVAHALLRHGGERVSQGMLVQLGAAALAVGMQNRDPKVVNGWLSAYGVATDVGVMMPFGRDQESEADHVGLILMTKGGYEPNEAIPFWERMDAAGGSGPPEFLSTHPSHESRITKIRTWLPEMDKYRANP